MHTHMRTPDSLNYGNSYPIPISKKGKKNKMLKKNDLKPGALLSAWLVSFERKRIPLVAQLVHTYRRLDASSLVTGRKSRPFHTLTQRMRCMSFSHTTHLLSLSLSHTHSLHASRTDSALSTRSLVPSGIVCLYIYMLA